MPNLIIFTLTVWDPCFIIENDWIHLFILQGVRMWYQKSSIAHGKIKVTDFLEENWNQFEMCNVAIEPGSHPLNSGGVWSGSVIKIEDESLQQNIGGKFLYSYTAADSNFTTNRKQRILFAVSSDLNRWNTISEVQIPIDYNIYEAYLGSGDPDTDISNGLWYDESWRDPFVIFFQGLFHAFISARVNEDYSGEIDFMRRGCIAHASSKDLITWKVHEPVYMPRSCPELEVSQWLHIGDYFYLIFSAHPNNWADGTKTGGTYYLKSDNTFNFNGLEPTPLYATKHEDLYSGRILKIEEKIFFIAHYHTENRHGGLFKPIPIEVNPDGDLRLVFN